jgi:hypothetical protein
MRNGSLTAMNPLWVLSATAHSTEWINTNTRLAVPKPNHSMASGRSAMAGSGLNIAVTVARKSLPMRLAVAHRTSTAAMASPAE